MDALPLISTIIPMFNGVATIERTLRSVCAQTEGGVEILVINDGSTDDGARIVEGMSRVDPRIRCVGQANAGLPSARNTGLNAARGRFVHFLDADDTIEADAYEKLLEAARRGGRGASVAGHTVRSMDGAILETILLHRAEVGLDDLVDRVGFVCHAPLIERERLGATRFDTAFRSYEDLDFWFRLGESGLRWTVVNEPLVSYAMRPGSMSRNPAVMLYAAQSAVCNLFERQRARPEPARLMDASIERRDQRLTHFALSYATHAVMLGADVGVEEAMDLLADSRGRVWITPEQAAEKAHHGFTYALARRYDDDLEAEAAVLRPLGDFWRRCEARGWAAPGLASRAPRHLEFIRHEHAMVAGALLDELRGARRITIIGFGRNGAALAKAAQEREVEVVVRDDRFDVGGSPPEGVEVEAMGAPLGAGIPIVISPLDDAALFERFARAERVVRWSRVRQALLEPAMMRSGV